MASVTLIGDDELLAGLLKEARFEKKKAAVKKHGASLQRKAMKNAVFTKGYSTGATKRSITLTIGNGGMSAKVAAGTAYSGYVEAGTRKMEAQPFMKPALDSVMEAFLADLGKAE
ncbi:HK97-gp10 family putative phage morphogenesis protein [Streptococcus hyointestinalis]|uniref:HK97-gp10 family putative phage morphogenesis protein n=1 Tax=Streptococcus hyointestinalis TaxID=1337 RepID=UPI003519675F